MVYKILGAAILLALVGCNQGTDSNKAPQGAPPAPTVEEAPAPAPTAGAPTTQDQQTTEPQSTAPATQTDAPKQEEAKIEPVQMPTMEPAKEPVEAPKVEAPKAEFDAAPTVRGPLPSNAPEVTDEIRKVADSVFIIAVPDAGSVKEVSLTFSKGRHLRQKVRTNNDPVYRDVMLAQLDACEAKQSWLGLVGDACYMSDKIITGTGFLMDDGKTLWTAMPIAKNAIGTAEQTAEADPRLNVFVFDRKDKLLLNPKEQKIALLSQPAASSAVHTADVNTSAKDFLALQLPTAIGEPLRWASQDPKEGDVLTAISYPGGGEIRFSMGATVEQKKEITDAKSEEKAAFYAALNLNENTLGSPVFNDRGEIVGLTSAATVAPTDSTKYPVTAVAVPTR